MSEISTGGAAFPHSIILPNNEYVINDGLTIRDYFAAKAMQTFLAHAGFVRIDVTARDAYRMADAMLAEREKKE